MPDSWLETLRKRIEFVLPATTNPTQQTVFREWLHLVDAAQKDHAAALDIYRKENGRVYQDRHAAAKMLHKLGCHEEGCRAYKVIGRFGSRSGLRWAEGDMKTCDCGFAEGLQIHESGLHPRHYDEIVGLKEELRQAKEAAKPLKEALDFLAAEVNPESPVMATVRGALALAKQAGLNLFTLAQVKEIARGMNGAEMSSEAEIDNLIKEVWEKNNAPLR